MRNTYFFLLLAWLVGHAAYAQSLGYLQAQALNQAGTYTDLGTMGTVITTASTDDANSAAQPIGFSFVFDGTTYTQFILNTNGFIKLGAIAPATAAAFQPYAQLGGSGPVDNATLTDLILPFNTDLASAASAPAEYRVATTGTAPNRVCTVQWKNVTDKARPATDTNPALVPAQLASFSFQLKLYEVDRRIEFVYGPATASTAASAYISTTVGLKGQGNTAGSGQLLLAQKNSTQDWAAALFVDAPYATTFGHNVRNTFLPDAGRTYAFILPVPNDAAVAEIHALGTALVPGVPLSIDVVVRNVGTSAFAGASVTLTITGANTVAALTQPTGTLGVGASTVLTFSGISLSTAGANTVTASLPADGNTTNNVLTQALTTSASTISYAIGAVNTNGYGFRGTTARVGAFAARFRLGTARTVTSVQAFLSDLALAGSQASTVGQTVYGVILNATTGAVLARSPDFVVTSAAVNTTYSFALTSPVTLPAGEFLAGLATVVPANALPYFAMGAQREVPNRLNLFYSIDDLLGGATPVAYSASEGVRLMLGVTTSTPLAATAAAAPLVFSAYPNPSATGDFVLELGDSRGGAATLAVEVTDMLGRRVYSSTAYPNARTPLPLAGQAPGLYTLRLGSGAEQAQQQLCIAP